MLIVKTILIYLLITFTLDIIGKKIKDYDSNDLILIILIFYFFLKGINNNMIISFICIIILFIIKIFTMIIFYNKTSILIRSGKINIKQILLHRYNINNLFNKLYQNNIKNISDIDYAIINNDNLSIITKEKTIPLPLIYEGTINYEALNLLNKDIYWLHNNIKDELNNIFYCFYKNNNIYIIKNSDIDN